MKGEGCCSLLLARTPLLSWLLHCVDKTDFFPLTITKTTDATIALSLSMMLYLLNFQVRLKL